MVGLLASANICVGFFFFPSFFFRSHQAIESERSQRIFWLIYDDLLIKLYANKSTKKNYYSKVRWAENRRRRMTKSRTFEFVFFFSKSNLIKIKIAFMRWFIRIIWLILMIYTYLAMTLPSAPSIFVADFNSLEVKVCRLMGAFKMRFHFCEKAATERNLTQKKTI